MNKIPKEIAFDKNSASYLRQTRKIMKENCSNFPHNCNGHNYGYKAIQLFIIKAKSLQNV